MADSLETLIDKATDPARVVDGVDYSTPVCERINIDLNGPVVGLRYITTKVKSAREDEALLGLNLIEACVNNCGQRFHTEVGKYRFLNELIKLLSSKYDGDWTPSSVKQRIVEIMYSWSVGLPMEGKIAEAYKMLKQQGIVTRDPVDPYALPDAQPPPKQDTIFQDEEKSKLLARLLKSSHPEDLQAANRLIKTMVRQDEIKTERLAKRISEIDTCCNNIKLLTEMLNHYTPNSPPQDKELMKELYDACDKMRPQLFRLASSATEDGDEGLADILRVNDDLSKVLEYYRKVMGITAGVALPPGTAASPATLQGATQEASPGGGASTLIDLGVGVQSSDSEVQAVASAASVLENELKALGLHDVPAPASNANSQVPLQQPLGSGAWVNPAQHFAVSPPNTSSTVGVVRPMGQYPPGVMIPPGQGYMLPGQGPMRMPFQPLGPGGMSVPPRPPQVSMGTSSISMATTGMTPRGPFPAGERRAAGEEKKTPSSSLDLLSQELMQTQKQNQKQKQAVTPLQEKSASVQQQPRPDSSAEGLLSLGAEPTLQSPPTASKGADHPSFLAPTLTPSSAAVPLSLDNVFVPLDSITPGNHPPTTVVDKNNVRVIFHFAKTSAQLPRNDILVVVISTMSSLSSEVNNFVFQAAVPKTMKVKLQPPSGSELPPHNPILPPSAITQVMLIANPTKEKVRLKYRVTYQANGSSVVETGDVDNFPAPQQ